MPKSIREARNPFYLFIVLGLFIISVILIVQSLIPELYNYLIAGILILIAIVYMISTEISRLRKKYILTQTGIVKERGLIIKEKKTYNLSEVKEINLSRNVFGFIFNRGDLVLRFGKKGKLIMENIKNPEKIEKEIISVLNQNYSPDVKRFKLPENLGGDRYERK